MIVSLIRKKAGLLIRWAAKKNIPGTTALLIKLYPQHIYHLSYYFLTKKNDVFKAYNAVTKWVPKTDKETNYKERIQEIAFIISSNSSSLCNIASTNTESKLHTFNHKVMFCLHNSAPYDQAGYWHRTSAIFSSLTPAGVELSAVTRPGYPWDLIKHRQEPRILHDEQGGVTLYRLNDDEHQYRQVSDSRYVQHYAAQVAELVRRLDINVIHGHSNYLNGLAATQAAKILGVKSVYEARGLWHYTRLSKEPGYQHTDMFKYDDTMERMAMHQADAVVTLSSAMKSLIVSWGIPDSKVWIIPNAVDTESFHPLPREYSRRRKFVSDKTFLIGFIGSITVYEGLEDLIHACVQLNENGLDIHLVIIGSGPYEHEIRTLAAQHSCISYHDRVPHSEVKDWYSTFDMCAYPRKSDIVCQYVPPMKVLEAMAMGIPVLVSSLEPLIELVDNGKIGTICKASDLSSLTEKIEYMYYNQDNIQMLAKKGIDWIKENRTWHRNADLYKKMYQSLYETNTI